MSDLDPARLEAVRLTWQQHTTGEPQYIEEPILAADDARARKAGLVCTADELTLEWLRDTLALIPWWAAQEVPARVAALPPALRARLEGGEQRG